MASEGPPSGDADASGPQELDGPDGEDALSPGQSIGSYRVLHPIGEGGMGTVYLAEHRQIGYRAAIKVLHREYSRHPQISRRFLNEARAVNIVQHPGIVKIFEFGELPDRTAYIIMEHLDGEVLTRRLQRLGGRMPAAAALRLGRQIASALSAAHRRDVVHRDLKPGNIMLVPDPAAEGKERVKVLDFGLAKVAEGTRGGQGVTKTGVVLGTAMYMAPEQCRGARDVDGRADVYSLGIVLYEALCGRPPFTAESEGELVTMQLRDAPPPLRDLAPEVPAELAEVVHRLLNKDPRARPTMDQAQAQLDQLAVLLDGPQAGGPATARLPRGLGRRGLLRWIAVGLGGAVLVSALGWLAVERRRVAEGGAWSAVPSGTESHLRAVVRVGADELWAVGDRGTILHGRGVRWTAVPSETSQGLRAVWGSGPSDIWAVGGQGAVLRWDGLAWRRAPEATAAGLRGVWGAGSTDVWAVGEQGVILHYDGARWAPIPSGVNEDFRAVWGFAGAPGAGPARDVWAVGEYGMILHWDGTGWSRSASGTTSRLAKIWGPAPNDLWAVGNEGTVLRYDGARWRPLRSGTGAELSAVFGHGSGEVWVTGNDGTVLHWDGATFRRPPRPLTQRWLYGLCDGAAPGELWAVGTYGVILRRRP